MSLFEFLVTSNTRKRLLRLLWEQNVEASGHQLAQLAGGAYSAVHGELEAMKSEGLATSVESGRSILYKKNDRYTESKALKALLDTPRGSAKPAKKATPDDVRLNLVKYGAPLSANGKTEVVLSLEETLVFALSLARRDAAVARTLPIVLAKNKGDLNLRRLEFLARKHQILPVLGLFLDLTARLQKNRKLHKEAQRLMDRRRKRMEPFFVHTKLNPFEKELAERNTPAVARDWHFLLNVGMDSFEGMFNRAFPEAKPA